MSAWQALALTLACEVPVLLLLAQRWPWRRVLVVSIAASCLTHPLAWRAAHVLSPDTYLAGVTFIEVMVIVFEAVWYCIWLRATWFRALLWSILANACSVGLGFFLWHWI